MEDEKERVEKVRVTARRVLQQLGVITPNENLLDYLVKEAIIDAHTATKIGKFGDTPDYKARSDARAELAGYAGYDKKANITVIQNPAMSVNREELMNI